MRLIGTGVLTFCLAVSTAATALADSAAEQAKAALEEVAKTYRSAPTLTDMLTLDFDGEHTALQLRFDRDNTRVQFDVPGFAVMAIDGELLVTSDAVPDKYMKAEIEGSLTETLVSVFGSPESVPFHFVMRENRGVDAYLNALTLGFLQNPRVTGFSPAGTNDSAYHVIELSDGHGEAKVSIDPATNLIKKIRTELPPIPGMSDEKMVAIVTTNTVMSDALKEPITFDPADRKVVDSPEQLVPQMIEVGAAAPDFTLRSLDGDDVSLSDLRGKIVVLDFWATWCVPCIRALPDVERFAKWINDEGHPIEVFAVNAWEHRGNTLEERTKIAADFWEKQEFKTLRNLMDYDDSLITSMGIDSIPTTVIIDGEGKIYQLHVGYTPQMYEMLKKVVSEALEQAAVEG